MSDVLGLSTDSVNLASNIISCIRGIDNADDENDAAVQQSMALTFSIDLERKLQELDECIIKGWNKKQDKNFNNKIEDASCMLNQSQALLSEILEGTFDKHRAELIYGVMTIVSAAQSKLNNK